MFSLHEIRRASSLDYSIIDKLHHLGFYYKYRNSDLLYFSSSPFLEQRNTLNTVNALGKKNTGLINFVISHKDLIKNITNQPHWDKIANKIGLYDPIMLNHYFSISLLNRNLSRSDYYEYLYNSCNEGGNLIKTTYASPRLTSYEEFQLVINEQINHLNKDEIDYYSWEVLEKKKWDKTYFVKTLKIRQYVNTMIINDGTCFKEIVSNNSNNFFEIKVNNSEKREETQLIKKIILEGVENKKMFDSAINHNVNVITFNKSEPIILPIWKINPNYDFFLDVYNSLKPIVLRKNLELDEISDTNNTF